VGRNPGYQPSRSGEFGARRAASPGGERSGKIVVIVCGGAGHPRPNFAVYAATKAAVTRFVECVAEEVSGDNVQINCVAPGRAYTHMTDEILRAGEENAGANEIAEARQVRIDAARPRKNKSPWSRSDLPRSNHISGKLVESTDDWKRFEKKTCAPNCSRCAACSACRIALWGGRPRPDLRLHFFFAAALAGPVWRSLYADRTA